MSLITPDFGLLFWMTLIFAIVFFVLAKFGFPLITGMVKKRSDSIEQSLRDAEEARKSLKELAAEQKKLIEEARNEARNQTEQMLAEARQRIAKEQAEAMAQIKAEVITLSVDIAEKVLQRELSDKEAQSRYIEELLKNNEHPNIEA